MFSVLTVLALLLPHSAVTDPRSFTAGSYTIEQRVAGGPNRYAGTRLDFLEGGDLVWVRDGQPFAMMKWSVTGDLMRIEDTELCILAPIGLYRVNWMEKGFVFDRLADDCGERAASATTLMLVPVE